jgi:hypothetical protein
MVDKCLLPVVEEGLDILDRRAQGEMRIVSDE